MSSKILDKDKIDAVLYHGYPCLDGFGSAMIVWLYYKKMFGEDAVKKIRFIGIAYGDKDPLPDFTGKNVIMLDFSFKKPELMALIDKVNSFIILDHHKTAEEDLVDVPSQLKIFDMKRSGVGITWEFFFPGVPMPLMFQYIQDRDLWTKAMPLVDVFTLVTDMMDRKFEVFEELLDEKKLNETVNKGIQYAEYQKYLINDSANHGTFNIVEIDGELRVIAYCNTGAFMSDVGNRLFTKYPFADFSCIYYYNNQTDETKVSLRSTNDRMDVSAIAKQFGGGGHRNASGCSFKGMQLFPFKIVDRVGELLWAINSGEIKVINGKNICICWLKSREPVEKLLKDPAMRKLIFSKFNSIHWVNFRWIENQSPRRFIYRNGNGIDIDPTFSELYMIQTELEK